MNVQVIKLADADAVAWEAASRVAAAGREAVRERGRFTLALSGGSTPRRLFGLLGMSEWLVRVPWEQAQIFWADERCVPPDSPESNYGEARALLLNRLPVAPEQIHRWRGEAADPEAEAVRYGEELMRDTDHGLGDMPRLDLILLGMGTDGHTASLFPHSPALAALTAPTAANVAPVPPTQRLTMTLPALGAARSVLFLVTGADKAATLARVLEGPPAFEDLPAQAVQLVDGSLAWLVDAAAAARLTNR